VDPWGSQVETALAAAKDAGIEWLAVDFDWARIWPERASGLASPEFAAFMRLAEERGFNVLVSLTDAPPWAMTGRGPDSLIAGAMSLLLARTYPAMAALEPFPAANTAAGWGAPPDPAAYLELVRQIRAMLGEAGRPVTLVVGGLAPADQAADSSEAAFLESLYDLGGADILGVLGVRPRLGLPDPLVPAGGRRLPAVQSYEEARLIMLQQGHPEAVIWVTGFGWPAGARGEAQQADWLERAFRLINAQLYIEAGFFAMLNPSSGGDAAALLLNDGRVHPALNGLATLLRPPEYEQSLRSAGGSAAP
jgi:hypothetical protein